MTLNLRKKVFKYKVEKMITTNRFVFFFQYNSINNKQWNEIKNRILQIGNVNCAPKNMSLRNVNGLKTTISIIVGKNKVFKEIQTCLFSRLENLDSASGNKCPTYTIDKKFLIDFFSQGPTVLIAFQSVEQGRSICKILENVKNKHSDGITLVKKPERFLYSGSLFRSSNETVNQAYTKKTNHLPNGITGNLREKIPPFTNTLNTIFQRKYEKNSKNDLKNQLFFIGGLAENQIIDHLDLKALVELNPAGVYKDFLVKLREPLMCQVLVLTSIKTVFVKTLKLPTNNLINCLILRQSLLK